MTISLDEEGRATTGWIGTYRLIGLSTGFLRYDNYIRQIYEMIRSPFDKVVGTTDTELLTNTRLDLEGMEIMLRTRKPWKPPVKTNVLTLEIID